MSIEVVAGAPPSLAAAVLGLLPQTGSVEVQRDTPLRTHAPHTHSTDETLLIVSGEITFTTSDRQVTCRPGERLLLPRGTQHSSVAGAAGCVYVIALELRRD